MEWASRTLYDSRIGVDFNQIYFPNEVGTLKDFRGKKMNKSLFRIVSSEFGQNDVGCGDYFKYTLKLDLVKADNKGDKPSYPYLLDGSISTLAFISNMEINPLSLEYGPVESLHEREVYGFISRDWESGWKSIWKNRWKGKRHVENGRGIIEAIALKPKESNE
jgi:hypothetical protein